MTINQRLRGRHAREPDPTHSASPSSPKPTNPFFTKLSTQPDAIETLSEVAEYRNKPIDFVSVDPNKIKVGLTIKSKIENGDVERGTRDLMSNAINRGFPTAIIPVISYIMENEILDIEILKEIKGVFLEAALFPQINPNSPRGFTLVPFSKVFDLGSIHGYVTHEPEYLRKTYGAGGVTTRLGILLASEAQLPARHEIQHAIDRILKPWPKSLRPTPEAEFERLKGREYRAKLAEIIYSEDTFRAVLGFRSSVKLHSASRNLTDDFGREAHRHADARIVKEFDGIPKTQMKQRAFELLDLSYQRAVGVSLSEILDFCSQR